MKPTSLFIPTLLALFAFAAPARADEPLAQKKLNASLDTMVQDVYQTDDPAVKRNILGNYLTRLETGVAVAAHSFLVPRGNREELGQFHERLQGYSSELATGKVGDGDLNALATTVRTDTRSAEAAWGGGGIYLSTGAVIILIIILIIFL